ncbi:hypothetical protein [Emticicia sp. W12TSBA100-4]|uniref:hypothetical protein n=1 Tax=Emticicia sp. W12TSBA100-4 TaxID=3160965 RepID=UPI003306618A
MVTYIENPTDSRVLSSYLSNNEVDFGLNILRNTIGLNVVRNVDKSSSQFNNAGIKPNNSVKKDFSMYYIGGLIGLIFLFLIILIARKV